MKAVVLAGGTGSRLYPLTFTTPKQLLPVANRSVLEFVMEELVGAGIEEVGVVLGEKGRDTIQERLGDGSRYGIDITYIVQGEPLGLAHAVGCAEPFVGDEPFVLYLGDILVEGGVTELVDEFDPSTEALRIGVKEVDEPGRYGIVYVDEEGQVSDLVEKPADPASTLASIGINAYAPTIFEEIPSVEPSWRGELELSDANKRLIDRGERVTAHVFDEWWADTGTPDDMLAANRFMLQSGRGETTFDGSEPITGPATLDNGTHIGPDAMIRPPVAIGDDVDVVGEAVVGPNVSVGSGARVADATVEDSILLAETSLDGDVRIVESLLGSGATIGTRSDGASLVVADETEVEL